MTFFDVRVPGVEMTVVQADGNDVEPVTVDEFRIGVAETYDVIVQPKDNAAYTIFAQPEDRSGYVRGTLAPKLDMTAAVPPMDPRPMRTMMDMGNMAGMKMDNQNMAGMDMGHMKMGADSAEQMQTGEQNQQTMTGMEMGSSTGTQHPSLNRVRTPCQSCRYPAQRTLRQI